MCDPHFFLAHRQEEELVSIDLSPFDLINRSSIRVEAASQATTMEELDMGLEECHTLFRTMADLEAPNVFIFNVPVSYLI